MIVFIIIILKIIFIYNIQTFIICYVRHKINQRILFLSSMAGIRLQPEDSDVSQQSRAVALSATDLVSDDDRSVAADSWSIKSEYGSTLDDDQRHADAAEALSNANLRPPSDYRFTSSLSLSLSLSHTHTHTHARSRLYEIVSEWIGFCVLWITALWTLTDLIFICWLRFSLPRFLLCYEIAG